MATETDVREALRRIRDLKSEPIGETGFATGPLALLNAAQRIAREALSASPAPVGWTGEPTEEMKLAGADVLRQTRLNSREYAASATFQAMCAASPSPAPTQASPPDQTRKEGDEPVHDGRHSPRAEQSAQAKTPSSLGGNVTTPPHPSPPDEGEYEELIDVLLTGRLTLRESLAYRKAAATVIQSLQAKVGELNRMMEFSEDTQRRTLDALEAAESALATERERADALRDFAAHTDWELSFLSEEEGDDYWAVHEVVGNVNDREWNLIGRGDTPHGAVAAALRALEPKEPGNGN